MIIFINSPIQNHNLKFKCQLTDLVTDLKVSIEKELSIPVSKQLLIFHCKVLKNNSRLQEYEIKENSTIFLNVIIQGGAGKIMPIGNKTKKQLRQQKTYYLENIIKDNQEFLPEGFTNIENLKEMFQQKIQRKKFKNQWNPLITHHDSVYTVVVSNNNRFVISGSADKSIIIFDIHTEQEYHHFIDAHQSAITSITICKDNRFFISSSGDNSMKIFDIQAKKENYHFIDAHKAAITSVCVSNDNKFIVSASMDKSLKIFDFETKEELHHFEDAHSQPVWYVGVSNDNKFIISGSGDKSIKIFDIQTKQEHYHFKDVHHDSIIPVVLSNDDKLMISGSADKSIKVFDFQTKQELHHFKDAHNSSILSIAISNDNKFIVSGSADGSVKIFDLQTKQEHYEFNDAHCEPIWKIALSSDNRFIVSASEDKLVRIFDLQTKQEHHHFIDAHEDSVRSITVTNDNRYIVSGSEDKSVRVFNLKTHEEYHHFRDAHYDAIRSVVVTKDSRFIISGSDDKSIKIFDLQKKQEHYHFKDIHSGSIRTVAVSNDNRFIISGSGDKSIKVFNLQTKQEYYHFKDAHNHSVWSVAISPDNKFIVSGSVDKSIKIFDLQEKHEYHHFEDAHTDAVTSVAISNDNRYIISGSGDKSIKVFDFQTKVEYHHFIDAHNDLIWSVDVSNDSKFIISGSADNSIKIFDIKTKQEHYHFKDSHSASIYSITVSNDNRFIVSGSDDKSIKVFLIPKTEEADIFYESHKFPYVSNLVELENYLYSSANPESLRSLIIRYQDLYFAPYYWTILHFICLFQNIPAIINIPSFSEFRVPFLLDRFGKTPLHYLVSQENVHYPSADIILNYILDYLESKTDKKAVYELELVFQSLGPLFPFILSKTNPKTRDRYLKTAFMPSYAIGDLPLFGSPQTRYVFTQTSLLRPEIINKIFKKGREQIMFRTMILYLDYNVGQDDMHSIVWTLFYLNNEDIFKSPVISHLINYLWDSTQHIMIISALPFWIYMVLVSIYFGLGARTSSMEIVIILLAMVLLIEEFIQISSLNQQYVRFLWNTLDISQILLTIVFFTMRLTNDEEEEDTLASQWISAVIIMIGYIRWVSYLRLFKATRNLIQVIISTMKDMIGFIVILIFIIVGFSLIFLQFNRDSEYPVHLYDTYLVLYGSYDTTDTPLSQKLLAALILFLLNVVLLNLLISIMSDSYDKVQERRLLTDSVTRLEMILEAMAYLRFFKRGRSQEKGFLIYCLPEKEEEDNPQNGEWEGRINMIKKMLKQNEQKVEELEKKIEEKMEKSIEEKTQKVQKKIEEKIEKIEEKLEANNKAIESSHQEILKKIEQLLVNKEQNI